MKPTLEQLNELSNDELNCETEEKLKLQGSKCRLTEDIIVDDYVGDPRLYMPIAIEHCIDIDFNKKEKTVCCSFWIDMYGYTDGVTDDMPKAQTGRAVCVAFLLMELNK